MYKKKVCPVCLINECAVRAKRCRPCYFKTLPGRKLSEAHKKKMSEIKMGELNPMWKGDHVGYLSLHEWIKNRIPNPGICPKCGEKPTYDMANISGTYKRDINDWEWLCRRCHMASDGRLAKLTAKKPGCSSKYRGVTWNKINRNWTACIRINNQGSKYIGSFTNEEEAAKAYDKMAIETFGQYASLNFSGESSAYTMPTLLNNLESPQRQAG